MHRSPIPPSSGRRSGRRARRVPPPFPLCLSLSLSPLLRSVAPIRRSRRDLAVASQLRRLAAHVLKLSPPLIVRSSLRCSRRIQKLQIRSPLCPQRRRSAPAVTRRLPRRARRRPNRSTARSSPVTAFAPAAPDPRPRFATAWPQHLLPLVHPPRPRPAAAATRHLTTASPTADIAVLLSVAS